MQKKLKIYIVVGEPSGDLLASGMMREIVKQNPNVEFRGLGGESMKEIGFKSNFDIGELSVMGVFEVIPSLSKILKRVRQTRDDILQWNPDVIVTVDSWGFASKLIGGLRKRGVKTAVIQYVAPQVWAWKKGRAKKVAKLVDRIMMLLPDEGRFFEKYDVQCDFIGHPVVERTSNLGYNAEQIRKEFGIAEGQYVICVLPGSRTGEVKRLSPIYIETLTNLKREWGDFTILIPTVSKVAEQVREFFSEIDIDVKIVQGSEDRYKAFFVSDFALATSGTVSLELVALGVPHVIAYKFNPLTNFGARYLVSVKFANLINLIADRQVIPEFVLHNCRVDLITEAALEVLGSPEMQKKQVAEAKEVLSTLRLADKEPSQRAAEIVLEMGGAAAVSRLADKEPHVST